MTDHWGHPIPFLVALKERIFGIPAIDWQPRKRPPVQPVRPRPRPR